MLAMQTLDRVETLIDAMRAMTDDELLGEVKSAIGEIADRLVRMAAAVRILDDRNVDLGCKLAPTFLRHLRRIGSRQMSPQAFLKFSGLPALRRIEHWSLAEQQRVCDLETVPLVVYEDGQPATRQTTLAEVSSAQLEQILGDDHIRTEREQIAFLRNRRVIFFHPEPSKLSPPPVRTMTMILEIIRWLEEAELPTDDESLSCLRRLSEILLALELSPVKQAR